MAACTWRPYHNRTPVDSYSCMQHPCMSSHSHTGHAMGCSQGIAATRSAKVPADSEVVMECSAAKPSSKLHCKHNILGAKHAVNMCHWCGVSNQAVSPNTDKGMTSLSLHGVI